MVDRARDGDVGGLRGGALGREAPHAVDVGVVLAAPGGGQLHALHKRLIAPILPTDDIEEAKRRATETFADSLAHSVIGLLNLAAKSPVQLIDAGSFSVFGTDAPSAAVTATVAPTITAPV